MTTFPFYAEDRAAEYERFALEYAFVQTDPTPWTPLRFELRRCRAALLTTAGLRLKTQHSFRPGSAEVREIPVGTPPDDLAFDLTRYDPSEAERDLNVILPADRMGELVERGTIGGLHETFFSFFGECRDLEGLRATAAGVAGRLRAAGCDVAFLATAHQLCNQTACVVARALEAAGLSTVCAVTVREVAQQIRVPRAVFVNFPFGRTFGPAGDRSLQVSVVADMVRALKTLDRPGRIVDLPYRWVGKVG